MKSTISKIFLVGVVLSLLVGCSSQNTAKDTKPADTTAKVEEKKEETTATSSVKQETVYVTSDWLKSALDGKEKGYENLIVAEVGYPLDSKEVKTYAEHIKGAIYVGIMEVEDATGSKEGAYNILPAEQVRDNALKHGITADTKVVLYGQDISGVARQAYAYLWLGVKDVKILNGGIQDWKAKGYEVETTANVGTPATDFGVKVPANPQYLTSVETAKEKLETDKNFKLVSIRSEDEWLGKTSGYNYIDKAGEPKGAVWGKGANTAFDVDQFVDTKDEIKYVKNIDSMKEVWKDSDFTLDNELAFYCGTGWRASVPFLVLYENGYKNISLYDGGWYQWLMHGDYPVQVGEPKTDTVEYTTVDKLTPDKAAK